VAEETAIRVAAAAGSGALSRLGAATTLIVLHSLGLLDPPQAAAVAAGLAAGEPLGRALERGLEGRVAGRKPRAAVAAARQAASSATTVLALSLAAYAALLAAAAQGAGAASLALGASTVALAAAYRSVAGHTLLAAGLTAPLYRAAVAAPAVALFLALASPRPGWGLVAVASGYAAGATLLAASLKAAGLARLRLSRPPLAAPEPAAWISGARMAAAAALAYLGHPGVVAASILFDAGLRVGVLAVLRAGRLALASGFLGAAACPLQACGLPCYAYALALGAAGLAGLGAQPPTRGVLAV